MNSIRLLGNTKVSISDSLFSSKNIENKQVKAIVPQNNKN